VNGGRWEKLDLPVEIEAPLEVRAEPDGRGGWRIRAERTRAAQPGTTLFGWLQAQDPDYGLWIGDETGSVGA
jgi:hypothetical protein